MGENGAGHPAARAMAPPGRSSESGISTAKIATPRPYATPASITRPVDGDWAKLATAPTLMLTPNSEGDDAASTSRIATPAPMAAEDQPWFRTGTTVPPPSMRSTGDPLEPPPVRQGPNPLVFKLVAGGVIAACLFIVTLAGAKVLYKRVRAPAATATTELATPPTVVATADLPGPAPRAAEGTSPVDPVPAAPEPAPTAAPAEAAPRATPVRSSPSPTRVTKPAPRRPPVPKKPARR
jgi:hypothetical protein